MEQVMEIDRSSSNPQSVDERGLHIKRPCLAVADLERSLAVYRDILGFRLDYLSDASPESYLYSLFGFPKHARLKFAALSTEYELRALALTEVKGVDLPPPTTPHRAAVVIQVRELAPTIQTIQDLGLKVIEPNYFQVPPNLLFTEQAFCDRDGHLIMLYDVKQSTTETKVEA
ncbi:MAG: VOC family protein [Cyanosarcina radialis HA8281-LM2]|jgi:catechol 2,3-dioxygenase-like lactoylglutathione lyase family enzyme|nr:VOC family protein [Cyanosarcina radialis HA8281-LM2]